MLWPEGPPHHFRDLDEPFESFVISKPGYYVVACTRTKIALYRVKPLAPLAVYSVQTDGDLPLLGIRPSPLGNRLVAWTAKEVLEYEVMPVGDVEERARFNQVVAPGPGEAVGTRELYIAEVARYAITHDIIDVLCLENAAFVVGALKYSRLGAETLTEDWSAFKTVDFEVSKAVAAPLVNKTALISEAGAVKVVSLNDPEAGAVDVCSDGAVDVAFNMRLGKLTVATESTIYLYSLDRPGSEIIDFPHNSKDITCLQWSAQGNALLIGSSSGWALFSALGMPIYTSDSSSQLGTNCGVKYADWSLASDQLFLLGTRGLYIYNVLRWSGLGTLSRPILFNSSRLQIFHDGQKTRLSASPWLIVPLPAFYMAENWPLVYACCSADGKYVAAAGSTGLMYFSVLSRNWKELPDRDMRVRGGIVWYGRSLVVPVDHDGEYKLQMYSPFSAHTRRNSTVAMPTAQPSEEEHVVSTEHLESRVLAMSLHNDLLAVLIQSAVLKIFNLAGNKLELVDEWRLSGVVPAIGRVRSIDLLATDRVLIFCDDQLTSLSKKDHGVYKKQVLADSIEYYFVDHRNLWLFDGHELSLHQLDSPGEPESQSAHFKVDNAGVYFKVDGYPVAINSPKGVVATIEAHGLASKDGSFSYIKPTAHIQVYLLHLLQENFDQLHKYSYLDYYDQVLQTLLSRALVNDSQLAEMIDIVKRTAKSWRHVIASCARKVETNNWPRLFAQVGESPAQLFDEALDNGDLETASEFLMVVHADKQETKSISAGGSATQRLFKAAFKAGKLDLCREVCEFLLAVDESGQELRQFQQVL